VLNIKEAMQQTIDELKEQNANFKLFLLRLQEKLETKDRESTNLQSQIGGLNVVRSLLKEKEDEIKKLNADLL